MAFLEKFRAIKVRLENNQALQQFCQEKFGKQLKVLTVFKQRTEIQMHDLPIVMITRPRVRREPQGNLSKKEHSVFLYAGFMSNDREQAPELSIEFEEKLEEAVRRKTSHPDDRSFYIAPADSSNDEGRFHPVYFLVIEFLIKDR